MKQITSFLSLFLFISQIQSQILWKDFENDSLLSGGWSVQNVIGSTQWQTYFFNSNYFARVSNYSGGFNTASETWFISPSVDLSNSSSAFLNFDNTFNFTGPDLEVLISTNYDGISSPNSATWTALNPNLSNGSYVWANSGDLDLSAFLDSSIYIGFKYTGSDSDGSTWEIDNILIQNFITSTTSKNTNNSLRIFPNPSHNVITIQHDFPLENIEIYNSFGQCVLTTKKQTIDLSNFEAGCYFVKAMDQISPLIHLKD